MNVIMEEKTAKELILFKLNFLREEIQKILSKWDIDNSDDFIFHAKYGKLKDAEMDAISIKQLDAEYFRLKNLLHSLSLDG